MFLNTITNVALSMRDNAPPPTGPIVSLVSLSIIMWIGVAFAIGFTILRTVYQYRSNGRFYANDYFIMAALVLHLATASTQQVLIPPMYELELVSAGLRPATKSFFPDANYFLRLQFACCILLWTTTWLVKFSLLSFFWRLFDSVQTPMRIVWFVMFFLTGATWITSVTLQVFACDPPKHFFQIGACAGKRDIFMSNLVFQFSTGTDIGVDVLIMLIPFPLLRKLQINKHQRRILFTIFCLPIIPISFAILRLAATNPTNTFVDPVRFLLFSMLENNTTIVTACLPSIRLFFARVRARNAASSSDGYSNGYPRNGYNKSRSGGGHHPSDVYELSNSLHGHKGRIPIQTIVKSDNGRVVQVHHPDDSTEEILEKVNAGNGTVGTGNDW